MWYFSYGSDLHRHSVADWCRNAERALPRRDVIRPAILSNYRLAFPIYEDFWKGGSADIVTEAGKTVSGALIKLSNHGWETLERVNSRYHDRFGREGGLRKRIDIKVTPYSGGPPIEATTFQLIHSDTRHVPPTQTYMSRLIEAAVEIGLSTMWVMHLKSFEVLEPAVRFEPPAPVSPMLVPPRFVRRFVERVPALTRTPRRELEFVGVD